MARARLIKPDFFDDEKMTRLPFGARLFYVALWQLADREGRLEYRPAKFFAYAFPAMGNERLQAKARSDAVAWLEDLQQAGCLKSYEVEGKRYLLIPSFRDHQKIHINEPKSTLPAPMDSNDPQAAPMDSNVAGSGSRNKAEAEAEAEAEADSPPAHPFTLTYVKRYQERRAGQRPPQTEHAACLALEREFGPGPCIELGNDLDWQKHPNYMRPILKERLNGDTNGTDRGQSAASANPGSVATGLSDMDKRRAFVAAGGRDG